MVLDDLQKKIPRTIREMSPSFRGVSGIPTYGRSTTGWRGKQRFCSFLYALAQMLKPELILETKPISAVELHGSRVV